MQELIHQRNQLRDPSRPSYFVPLLRKGNKYKSNLSGCKMRKGQTLNLPQSFAQYSIQLHDTSRLLLTKVSTIYQRVPELERSSKNAEIQRRAGVFTVPTGCNRFPSSNRINQTTSVVENSSRRVYDATHNAPRWNVLSLGN